MSEPPFTRFRTRRALPLAAALLGVQCAVMAVGTLRWPLTGDATLMHYVVFLMRHGMAPYRDIIDMNMPGAYAAEWAVMHTLGPGALAWRLWDLLLLALATLAMAAVAGPARRSAGFVAGALFALVHAQDGIPHEGQRDLLMTVLLLAAAAAVAAALRSPRAAFPMAVAGVLFGAAVTVKPTALPPAAFLLALGLVVLRQRGRSLIYPVSSPVSYPASAACLGFALPLLGAWLFLLSWHSLGAFRWTLTQLLPLDASLGRRPFGYFPAHGLSPVQPLGYLTAVLLLLIARRRPARLELQQSRLEQSRLEQSWLEQSWLALALLIGALTGFLGYAAQGKGYVYHRYPLLAFALLGWALVTRRALADRARLRGLTAALGLLGLAYAALFAGPVALAKALSYQPRDPTATRLAADLETLGGARLSGKVQCLDMSAGCIRALRQLRLVQSTGVLYDYTLLTPGGSPAVARVRKRFLAQINEHPPEVFIVTEQDYLFHGRPYAKLDRWSALAAFLAAHYRLAVERKPTTLLRSEPRVVSPSGYRLYLLRH